jgi:hypothetical protein
MFSAGGGLSMNSLTANPSGQLLELRATFSMLIGNPISHDIDSQVPNGLFFGISFTHLIESTEKLAITSSDKSSLFDKLLILNYLFIFTLNHRFNTT